MIVFTHPYLSVLAAFLTVALVLVIVGTPVTMAALWGAVAAVFMYVGSQQPRRSDEL